MVVVKGVRHAFHIVGDVAYTIWSYLQKKSKEL
jgi:trehalose/maltose hydrolase-like predicted phosphorylase